MAFGVFGSQGFCVRGFKASGVMAFLKTLMTHLLGNAAALQRIMPLCAHETRGLLLLAMVFRAVRLVSE